MYCTVHFTDTHGKSYGYLMSLFPHLDTPFLTRVELDEVLMFSRTLSLKI